jgi:carbamoyl-phosphate synthase large subunit
MKSTGEVMGTADTFGKAYEKAQASTNKPIPTEGTAVIDLDDAEFPHPDSFQGRHLRESFGEFFELANYDDEEAFKEAIKAGQVNFIVSRTRGPLEIAVEEEVTYFSTHPSALAALEALRAHEQPIDVQAISERTKRVQNWGE